jgi:hypothetical protein
MNISKLDYVTANVPHAFCFVLLGRVLLCLYCRYINPAISMQQQQLRYQEELFQQQLQQQMILQRRRNSIPPLNAVASSPLVALESPRCVVVVVYVNLIGGGGWSG